MGVASAGSAKERIADAAFNANFVVQWSIAVDNEIISAHQRRNGTVSCLLIGSMSISE
jgi:hypothetical protein